MPRDGVGLVGVEDQLEHAHVYDVFAVVDALYPEEVVADRDLDRRRSTLRQIMTMVKKTMKRRY